MGKRQPKHLKCERTLRYYRCCGHSEQKAYLITQCYLYLTHIQKAEKQDKSEDAVYWKLSAESHSGLWQMWQWWNDDFFGQIRSNSRTCPDVVHCHFDSETISLHYLWSIPMPFSKKCFLPRKNLPALSLSKHLLLLCVHLTLIVDWLSARPFTGIVWMLARGVVKLWMSLEPMSASVG